MDMTITEDQKHSPPVVAGLTPYTGTFGKEQIAHLLKRTMFGAKKADIDFFVGQTLTATIDTLLTEPPPLTDDQLPLNNYNIRNNNLSPTEQQESIDANIPAGKTWAYALLDVTLPSSPRKPSLKAWWIGNMVNQPRSIFEKMVLFWHNHFATELVDTYSSVYFEHVMLLRKHAMGNFKTFTKEMTLDANMLRYLNGFINIKRAPDENYARELQELFTLGKGPNSKFTEPDVRSIARLLTGWGIGAQVENPVGSRKYYWKVSLNPLNHDTAPKQFSNFFGRRVITNTANTEAGALKELDDALNMIFAKEEVALYMCRRIYRFFVYYIIDEAVETEVIKPMADIFRQSNYDIKPVLKALFSSEHFFGTALKACLIKSPTDNIIGFLREFEVVIPVNTVVPRTYTDAVTNKTFYEIPSYVAYLAISAALTAQGQDIGDPPNVAGWPAYYQEGYHEYWINTDTATKRLLYSNSLLQKTPAENKGLTVDVLKFTEQFGADAEDPNKLIVQVLEILYRVPPTQAMINYLKTTFLLSGQTSDYYWSNAWLAYKTNPTTANINTVKTRLQSFYLFITQNPHYQLA